MHNFFNIFLLLFVLFDVCRNFLFVIKLSYNNKKTPALVALLDVMMYCFIFKALFDASKL